MFIAYHVNDDMSRIVEKCSLDNDYNNYITCIMVPEIWSTPTVSQKSLSNAYFSMDFHNLTFYRKLKQRIITLPYSFVLLEALDLWINMDHARFPYSYYPSFSKYIGLVGVGGIETSIHHFQCMNTFNLRVAGVQKQHQSFLFVLPY